MKGKMRNFFVNIFNANTVIYFILLVVCFYFVWDFAKTSGYLNKPGFREGITVEAFGMLFDILILGVIFSVLFKFTENRRDIKRYLEEIDDFRGWSEPEAMYKNVGNIRRLFKLGVKWSELDLRDCYLDGCQLMAFNLRNANLERANLSNSNLELTNLRGANLKMANLVGANLEGANLEGANLEEASLQEAELGRANLERANLEGADLQDANLAGAKLEAAELGRANLRWANLKMANLVGAKLEAADLGRANMEKANLAGAKLEAADLGSTNMEKANLEGAELQGAELFRASLKEANLLSANLEGADLEKASLKGAKGINVDQLLEVKTLYRVKGLPPIVKAELRKRKPELFENPDKTEQKPTSTECKGITKNGSHCQNITKDPSGYCNQHKGKE